MISIQLEENPTWANYLCYLIIHLDLGALRPLCFSPVRRKRLAQRQDYHSNRVKYIEEGILVVDFRWGGGAARNFVASS